MMFPPSGRADGFPHRYLDAAPDYSGPFTDRVSQLGAELSDVLSADSSHDADMSYNAGQKLGLLFLPDGSPTTDPRAATYSLGIWISSKGPLWTRILHCGQEGDLAWRPCPLSDFPNTSLLDTIENFMRDKGLALVDDDILNQMAEGKETKMDGAPATIRDVLFCETC
ncbi:hypothetical protein [Actinomadura rudentiformis]|uniref:Uncharacterized protein n=1 Tax=Actinomadura rudentiformis TaxID=359158 RepID=A0A6H9YYM6_9ACTN|nr:hypothetical protein [Actinomadura rudentiformis]KAB2347837.1 hypothetical protein F8566_18260 [Actinomadura rudentiformis]